MTTVADRQIDLITNVLLDAGFRQDDLDLQSKGNPYAVVQWRKHARSDSKFELGDFLERAFCNPGWLKTIVLVTLTGPKTMVFVGGHLLSETAPDMFV